MRPQPTPRRAAPLYGYLDPRYLLHYAALDESNVAITGFTGAGKTTLVKTALKHMPRDFAAVIFDTAKDYSDDVCDERGEFSVDISKVEPSLVVDVIEEALEAVYGAYVYSWTPAMSELTLRALQSGANLAELAERVREIAGPKEESTALGVYRRLLHFKRPHFGNAPRLEPKPGAITCVNMNKMDPIARTAYVLLVLRALEGRRNIFYIIDEAHRFLQTPRKLITEFMRVGRHDMQLFVLITHSIAEISRRGYIKIYVRFPEPDVEEEGPQWEEPHKALVTIYVTNRRAAAALPGRGVRRDYLLTIAPP